MKILRNFSYSIVFVLLVGFIQPTFAKKPNLPHFKKNESYTSVRLKMLKAGWEPFHSENADTCSETDIRCKDRPEMEACAGTGMANCKFLWKKNEQITGICTVGEDAVFDSICD